MLSGEAKAFAVEAKAKAEAEQMAKKADAWKEYKEAAMVRIIKVLGFLHRFVYLLIMLATSDNTIIRKGNTNTDSI